MLKKLKGDPIFWRGIVCYAEKTFFVQFPGPTGTIWALPLNFVELLVELFWSLQVYRKKTLTKSYDYSRLFSSEKPRLRIKMGACNPVQFVCYAKKKEELLFL